MYNNENSQREILARRRDEGIDSLRQLSTRLNNVILNRGEPILDCTDVAGLEPDEMAALFDRIDHSGWNSEQIDYFIDRVIIRDTLDRDLDGDIREYLKQAKEPIDDDLQVAAQQEDKEPTGEGDGTKNEEPEIKRNQNQIWVALSLICISTLIVGGLMSLTQKTSNLPISAISSVTTVSTLETNKLMIGILGDQKKFTELKLYLQQKFGDQVQIQFEGNGETSYQVAKDKIASKEWDIVFTTSPMISIAAQDNHYTWAAKMFADKPLFYQSVIFVRADSQIRSIKDIKPQTVIALGDFSSASSFYMPSYTLYGKKLTVDRGHRGKEIVKMVKSGKADVGAVGYPERINDNDLEFRIIDKSRNIPGSGVYLSPKLSSQDRELLKYALLKDPQAVTASKQANYTSGEEPDYSQFKQITNRVQSMLTCVDWSQNQISFYCPEKETGIIGKVISALPSSTDSNQAHLELRISDRKTYPVIIPVPLINQIPGGGSLLNLKNKQIRLIDVQPNKGSNGKLNIKIDRASQINILE
jgi:ABC-type phosphate/phosphonate transport system substrate-binding protein